MPAFSSMPENLAIAASLSVSVLCNRFSTPSPLTTYTSPSREMVTS